MGMFDYVDCEYDLPMPEKADDIQVKAIKRFLNTDCFQTKSLGCFMVHYLIDENGLFREKIFATGRSFFFEPSDPVYIHQHMGCYGVVEVDEQEKWWLEYDLKFTDGIMVNAKVISWRKLGED
jgi:hypothetical protein